MARDWTRTAIDVGMFAASQVALYYTIRYMMRQLEGDHSKEGRAKLEEGSKALRRLNLNHLILDEYERTIAAGLIHPDDIAVRFSDIGGLENIITSLRESVIFPLTHPQLFGSSSLLTAPKGVLLYGPPGCGKSMLAKSLAKESGATFINITVSTLTNKWYGESNKLVHALFSLAKKVQPAMIFIDEIDCFLRERGKSDHEATGMMKAEFMTQWDGLLTGENTQIMVLGATNRPNDIDPAILRRMPKRFAIRLPDRDQRRKILDLMLYKTSLSPSVDISLLAAQTEGFSGSDLQELCRNAAMVPLKEFMHSPEGMKETLAEDFALRPLTMGDFLHRDGDSLVLPRTHSPVPKVAERDPFDDPE